MWLWLYGELAMAVVTGIGWITAGEYGCVAQGRRAEYGDLTSLHSLLQRQGVLADPIKHFGRFDAESRMVCCSVALALHDASMPGAEGGQRNLGLVGTSAVGCLEANRAYFKDYVETGRTLARGNLFIYTLPSTPLAEAAIHFGCRGPLMYLGFPEARVPSLLRHAGSMIRRGEASGLLAIEASATDAVCFVLKGERDPGPEALCDLDEAAGIAETAEPVEDLVRGLEMVTVSCEPEQGS